MGGGTIRPLSRGPNVVPVGSPLRSELVYADTKQYETPFKFEGRTLHQRDVNHRKELELRSLSGFLRPRLSGNKKGLCLCEGLFTKRLVSMTNNL